MLSYDMFSVSLEDIVSHNHLLSKVAYLFTFYLLFFSIKEFSSQLLVPSLPEHLTRDTLIIWRQIISMHGVYGAFRLQTAASVEMDGSTGSHLTLNSR